MVNIGHRMASFVAEPIAHGKENPDEDSGNYTTYLGM
jgi:hypothetical protein